MKIANKIVSAILAHYPDGSWKVLDLAENLANNRIDSGQQIVHKHKGYDESFDKSLFVFYYEDGSAIVVGTSGITAI